MEIHLVNWKTVKAKNIRGSDYYSQMPVILDLTYCGKLLSKILAMPKQRSISFADAISLLTVAQREPFNTGRFGDAPGHYRWYVINFVDWISSQGYHIEMTGDEFESYALPDKFA